jgi:cyclopropane fatty-acyl-phospholipid synthase-like methyltransferase
MKTFYNILYRYFRAPWDIGPRRELVELVESGRIRPGRAIDLGSGTASNAIYLAQHGFDVLGVDFSQAAVENGRRMAQMVGVKAEFVVDDLTDLREVRGTFDLLVDYGTLDDLNEDDRDRYVRNVAPLTRAGSIFLLYCFEWTPRWWERLVWKLGFLGGTALEPGEAERRFGRWFDIEQIAGEVDYRKWPPGYAVYLMRRKPL